MNLSIWTYQLKLRHTFRIAHGSREVQPSMVVGLSGGSHTGYGEATATSYYGLTLRGMVNTLEQLRPIIEAAELVSPESFWEHMRPHLGEHPFVQCALDEAAHDLYARQKGVPLYQHWGLQLRDLPLSNYTIGIGSIEEMVAKIKEQPWPVYKIKLGTEDDLAIIKALREHTDAIFRVDANTAWTAEQTIALAPELQKLGVEFIEQPLKVDDWEGMQEVFKYSTLPVIADESCQVEQDIDRCQGYFHGVNIKLMKCGGLTPARRMIQRAKTLGMKVMVGCMTESSVGISAIAHLLPMLDYVDMDGALLLKEDIATGVCLDQGVVQYVEKPGTGVELIK